MSMSLPRLLLPALSVVALAALTACSGVSELTRQQVARSDTAVKQATATIGNSEAGAVELQRAKETYARAQKAVEMNDDTQAQRLAVQAELDAQLAVAKSQNAAARKAADDVLASIQTLRQESERSSSVPR